jgi:hypothetical protein
VYVPGLVGHSKVAKKTASPESVVALYIWLR